MARRKARRTTKIQPAETVLNYILPPGVSYLDINHDLAMLNRRGFRQGTEIYVTVELFGNKNAANAAEVSIFRAPRTWVVANAWVMAFKNWKEQQKENTDDSSGIGTEGKFNDFKIFLDDDMQAGTTLVPSNVPVESLAVAIDPDALSDWDYSQFVVPNDGGVAGNTVEYYGHLLGPDIATSKGLVHAYAEARPRPQPADPSIVSTTGVDEGGLYADMEDVGEIIDEVLTNVRFENNAAPYVVGGLNSTEEFYPGGENEASAIGSGFDATANHWLVCEDSLIVRAGATVSTDVTAPFGVICGLLRLYNNGDDIHQIKVRVMPGPHKGINALPMQDVN